MQKWFTSDSHFGHDRIRELCGRPFSSVQEMDEKMIQAWNEVVQPKDEVYHLGDFSFHDAEKTRKIRSRLNGNVYLIRGNHDKPSRYGSDMFGWVKDYYELNHDGARIVLFHFGLRVWHSDLKGSLHLFGHSHGKLPSYGRSMDVGVDAIGYRPISFTQVRSFLSSKPIAEHGDF